VPDEAVPAPFLEEGQEKEGREEERGVPRPEVREDPGPSGGRATGGLPLREEDEAEVRDAVDEDVVTAKA